MKFDSAKVVSLLSEKFPKGAWGKMAKTMNEHNLRVAAHERGMILASTAKMSAIREWLKINA